MARDGPVLVTAGETAAVVDLTFAEGLAALRLEGHRERAATGDRYVSPKLSGVQVQDEVRIYRVTVNGAEDVG